MCSTNSSSSSMRSNRPGFVFQPNDEQLISFYLTNKVLGRDYEVEDIATLDDICKYEPSDLPEFSTIESGVKEWYFFCAPKYKYKNSELIDRKTRAGYWKVTCKPRKIKSRSGTPIGEKTTLVFHEGSVRNGNGKRTSWFLYQYNLISDLPNQKKWVFLYKLKKKDDGKADASSNVSQPSYDFPPVAEEDAANANGISLDDFGDFEMPEAGQGDQAQMGSDESQPSNDLATVAVEDDIRLSLEDLEHWIEHGDGQIAHEISHWPPEMRSNYQEMYDSLLSELPPQMQGELQQASSSSWGFPLSNDSSSNTSQNHYYPSDINEEEDVSLFWGTPFA